jgi:taurine dioxygenase
MSSVEVDLEPLDAPLGARVHGLDPRAGLSAEEVEALKKALAEFGVVVFSQTDLSEEQQVAFAEALGETEVPWLRRGEDNSMRLAEEKPGRPGYSGRHPSCHYWTNGPGYWDHPDDGFLQEWHADLSYLQHPLCYSLLYCVQAPQEGYETWFSNQYLAFESLSPKVQERVASLQIVHDFKTVFPQLPAVVHPLVRKHPISGRRSLYAIPGFSASSPLGIESEAGRRLTRELTAHLQTEVFVYKHTWTTGDLLIWDNRCVLHRRGPQIQGQTRILRRMQASDHHDDIQAKVFFEDRE